jgi:hypothetical protein
MVPPGTPDTVMAQTRMERKKKLLLSSADLLYLKPAKPVGRFCRTANCKRWFSWLYHCLYIFLYYSKVHALVSIFTSAKYVTYNPTMLNSPNPLMYGVGNAASSQIGNTKILNC